MKDRREIHNRAVRATMQVLRERGFRVADEAGIFRGRVDIVRLNDTGRWVELYEVKTRAAMTGIAQLERYGAIVGGNPALTLVVPPSLVDEDLIAAAAGRVRVWALLFDKIAWKPEAQRSGYVYLRYIAQESIDAMMAEREAAA